tara:strand:- start:24845 stop:30331 length:5487 start_codon:yes stop_codon:yes gene_type:complete
MPPYDRRSRQKGFNTRIPIYSLSGGVGRQAPSKRLPSEAQVIDNATPTLEKSIEKRANSNQLTTYDNIAANQIKDFGGLGLPTSIGANATLTVGTVTDTSATASWAFNSQGIVGSTIKLISSDATTVNYIVTKLGNSGYETESTSSFTFKQQAVHESTITLEAYDGTKKTFIAKDKLSGANGTPDGSGYLQFSSGYDESSSPLENAHQAALNFQEAFYSSNGFNNNSSLAMTFNAAATVGETVTFTSANNVTKTYKAQANGTVTNGDLAGSIVLFNAGTNGTEASDNLAAAINSTNGHNETNTHGSATWTFNTGTPAAGTATITLLITSDSSTTVSKTYKSATSGNNGDLDSGSVKFLQGNSANEVAANLREALLSSNGHGAQLGPNNVVVNNSAVAASTTFTFSGAATNNGTLALTDAYGTTKTYKAIDSCSDCPKLNSGNIEFNSGNGVSKVAAANNFVEAVTSSVGHNGTIRAVHTGSGVVVLTQTMSGTVGNTTVTSAASWDTACSVNPTNFTSGAGGGDITITQPYAKTTGNTTITDSTDFASACSAAPPAAFTGGANSGASGTQFTVTSSSGVLTLANVLESKFATSRVQLSPRFSASLSGKPPARFGKMHCEVVGTTGKINLEMPSGGDTGNKSIGTAANFTDALSVLPATFSRLDYTYINRGTSASDFGKEFRGGIENSALGAKITVTESSGTVTLTQATTGVAGNTTITTGSFFTNAVTSMALVFTGGLSLGKAFHNRFIKLVDVKGNTQTFHFKENEVTTTESIIALRDATTNADVATEIIKAINLNTFIRITASADTTTIVKLKMDDAGGNGTTVKTDTSYLTPTVFKNGSLGDNDFFYYWFAVSDDLRYLVVVNYQAKLGDKLFYIYKVDTDTNKVEDQTPSIEDQPAPEVYQYITHKNDTKTASEALTAITVGTNIYILNKFVKAGYSSSDNGKLFDLDGVETNVPDYKGKEITYYSSSVVDPDGTAFLYVPNKTYSAGTEVYNAQGVWKALTNIRAEETNTFSALDADETVTPADPGPPNYSTTSDNFWYPYKECEGTTFDTEAPSCDQTGDIVVPINADGKGRIKISTSITQRCDPASDPVPVPAHTCWKEGMTPSEVTSGDTRTWKKTVKDSNGIELTPGDIVYDIAHSRASCEYDSTDCGEDEDRTTCEVCHDLQNNHYIPLWQYVRDVKQVPVQDSRYVSKSQQYIGQSFTDWSNVKLPPHPSDPTDIIDLVEEICFYDEVGELANRTGDAARTIGILYENRTPEDYYDSCEGAAQESKSHAGDHTYGLGKILYVENSYAGLDPGYYRINSSSIKPYIEKIRTPFKHSRLDEKRMPHKMAFILPTENENARWALTPENWFMRRTGDEETNTGPTIFKDGAQRELKAMGFFRNRLWLAGEDKVFSSKLNEINNFWLTDPTSITDEDPIDITCSFNKYSEVVSLTPFEEFLFVNTGSDVQFTLKGSDNQITPFTAEISPTSFYSTAPLVQPVLLGSQIYFFDKKRVYVYFNEKTVSINNAIEVSYHCPDYLPLNFGEATVVSPYDTMLVLDEDNKKDMYCYTNRYSGEQVIQNAFFRYTYNNEIESINCWDTDIYTVIQTQYEDRIIYHVTKQPFKQLDTSIPLVDNSKTITVSSSNTTYDENKDETTFTFDYFFNPKIDHCSILPKGTDPRRGESFEIQSKTITPSSTKIVVNGKYAAFNKGMEVNAGTKFKTLIELSPVFYRDEANNVVDGVLSLRTMHLRHHNTGNYRVDVTKQGRKTTPIVYTSKDTGAATDLMPLENLSNNGETVSKILGFSDEVKIELISDYATPMNITNIELKGRFNATYSSWVR